MPPKANKAPSAPTNPQRRQDAKNQKPNSRAIRKFGGRNVALTPSPTNGAVRAYVAALSNPFDTAANGARVPEPFAVMTKTTRNRTPITVTANSSGVASFVVLPNPITTLLWSTGAGMTVTGGVDFTPYSAPIGGAGIAMTGVVGAAALDASCASYRIVGMGVRIKPNVSFTSASGKFVVALVPSTSQAPYLATAGSMFPNLLDAYGIPCNSSLNGVAPSILSFPKSMEMSHTELLSHGGLEITMPVTSADAWRFKTATYAKYTIGGVEYVFPGTTALPGLVVESSVNTVTGIADIKGLATDPDASSLGGFSTLAVYAEGLGSGTTFVVETIMHLEAIPAIAQGNTASGVLVDDSLSSAVAAPNANMVAAQAAARLPQFSFVDVKAKAAAVGGRIARSAGRAVAGEMAAMAIGLMA